MHKGFVKEPVIGLSTIKDKLRSGRYKELLHFNKDTSRVFSNVKYFNADRNVNNAKTDHIIDPRTIAEDPEQVR